MGRSLVEGNCQETQELSGREISTVGWEAIMAAENSLDRLKIAAEEIGIKVEDLEDGGLSLVVETLSQAKALEKALAGDRDNDPHPRLSM